MSAVIFVKYVDSQETVLTEFGAKDPNLIL
jgi:hypothetical protein